MNRKYVFEPTLMEVILTELVGSTLLRGYYNNFVNSLNLKNDDKVLDYCSGSGAISKKIAKSVKNGQLIFADVSKEWLKQAEKKLCKYKMVNSVIINNFDSMIMEGKYDKIIIHFALHDFPEYYRVSIMNQLVKNLKPDGILFIREPMDKKHGIKLFKLVNLLESLRVLSYEYNIITNPIVGKFINLKCQLIK